MRYIKAIAALRGAIVEEIQEDGWHATLRITLPTGETMLVYGWCGRHPCYRETGPRLVEKFLGISQEERERVMQHLGLRVC